MAGVRAFALSTLGLQDAGEKVVKLTNDEAALTKPHEIGLRMNHPTKRATRGLTVILNHRIHYVLL